MTPDEAREVAWRKWAGLDHAHAVARTAFTAGWNARGEYDKEQIAALVGALSYITNLGDPTSQDYIKDVAERAEAMWDVAELTLADQSEAYADIDVWLPLARAAIRAAFSHPSSDPPASEKLRRAVGQWVDAHDKLREIALRNRAEHPMDPWSQEQAIAQDQAIAADDALRAAYGSAAAS